MSYCRISFDPDCPSDVFTYADVDGTWTTHVASGRYTDGFHGRTELIGLPHDGETIKDVGPGECAETLKRLREIGYIVPQEAIDALIEGARIFRMEDDESESCLRARTR